MIDKDFVIDPVSGLPNQQAMCLLLTAELSHRQHHPESLSVGFIEISHSKDLHDRQSPAGTERLLADVAKVLVGAVRQSDVVGRWSGSRFWIIAPDTNLEGAIALGQRIQGATQNTTFVYDGHVLRVNVSIGLSVADATTNATEEQMKTAADAALSKAIVAKAAYAVPVGQP